MNHTLFAAARELVERARRDGQSGRQADSDDLDRLARALGAYLPDWYRSLLATVPLIGLELGVVASGLEVDDEISWLEWLDPGSIHAESLDLYPGIAVLEYGYLCVGRCAHGTGDQYFLKTSASDDPPLVQIAHDAGANPDLILQNGVMEIATTLSGFFADAKTRLA
jgi:hypothetical protein